MLVQIKPYLTPVLLLLCWSCSPTPSTATEIENVLPTPKTPINEIRFLALGDSYTVGEGVPYEESWPAQLGEVLTANLQIPVTTTVLAETGMTTAELNDRFQNSDLEANFNLISLQIGVNDQFRGYRPEIFQADFERLLQTIIQFNKGVTSSIFVVSIPDWGYTPFGTNWDQEKIRIEIDQFNLIAKGICARHLVRFVDITPISRASDSDWSLVVQDGLHPSAKMYGQWVNKMLPEVRELIQANAAD